ncbi:hypothetical protein MIS33_04055 [Wielerella bovis]|uniref:hypothetical protein n=1 Tax=Wielerella bovis TaxID=2917790 RepID=UPI002019D991|nr:hypothetical protein [Wielerella bovis]ULJ65449.1 hypothetical protein MIS33_04055 [Wielerella bovis]
MKKYIYILCLSGLAACTSTQSVQNQQTDLPQSVQNQQTDLPQSVQNQQTDLPQKALAYKQSCEQAGGKFDVLKSTEPKKYAYYGCMVNGVGKAIRVDF